MSLVRNGGAAAPRPPLWRADAAERLRALLPEMALLVVTTTCFSIAISLDGATNLLTLCVKMAVCQLIVQTVMYAFTYLSEDRRMVSLGPIIVLLASYVVSALPSFRTASVGGYGFATFMAMYLGVVEFCVTRLRVTFVFLLIELVVLIGEVAEWGPLMALHLVAIACLFALFFIRSSAVHITVGGELAEPAPTAAADEGRERPILGIYAQVAAVGVAACVLCLAMALATMPLWWPGGGGARRQPRDNGDGLVHGRRLAVRCRGNYRAVGLAWHRGRWLDRPCPAAAGTPSLCGSLACEPAQEAVDQA